LAILSILMMEALRSSEMSAFTRATWRHITQDDILQVSWSPCAFVILPTVPQWWPPLWSSGQTSWLLTQRSGFDSRFYQIFWVAVGLERGPLSPCESKWGATWKKRSGSGLENWD
jgi:hypothetical protein